VKRPHGYHIRPLSHATRKINPSSDYVETSGIIFLLACWMKSAFMRPGVLPAGYNLGFSDLTSFDARCSFEKSAKINWLSPAGTTEELLERCFQDRKPPNR
jgi:hypothetical protein